MAAQRAEAERVDAQRAAANTPKPGVGFRHTWNAEKQLEILHGLKRRTRPPQPPGSPETPLGGSASLGRTGDRIIVNHRQTRPPVIDRDPSPVRERRPPLSLPHQSVGSGLFTPPKPLIQKSTPVLATEEASPAPQPALSLADNEIRPPLLTRLSESEGFFDEPGQRNDTDTDTSSWTSDGQFPGPAEAQTGSENWSTGLFSKTKAQEPSQKDRAARTNDLSPNNVLRNTWDSVARHGQAGQTPDEASSSGGSWNSLTRRQQPGKGGGDDFWSKMEKTMMKSGKSSQTQSEPLEDWGKEFDNPAQRQQNGPGRHNQDRSQPRQAKGESRSSHPWNEVEKKGRAEKALEETLNVQSTPVLSPEAYQYEERKNRRQEPDRSSRFDIDRGQNEVGGKKRGGRSSRYQDEEDDGMDDGMDDAYEDYMDRRKRKAERKAKREAERTEPQAITLPELISISNLASALKVEKNLFLDQLAELGFEGISLDSIMAGETAALVAQEYGYEPTVEAGEEQDLRARPPPEDPSALPPRPPVVTIMGHVDHGKTTLLDFLRKSSVAAGEHGGITQHIGAFSVSLSSGKQMTFLDTPGHAAFLSMRQRGANVTDIVVLVVAADDSVKPQTLEALKHARGSKVPIIVAISKVDKDGAQIDRVKADLASNGVDIEDYGGDVQVVCVSGKTGQGMEDLEENILTLSEILDMRAETDGPAEGWILESSLKPIGKAATILVKRGTLRPGDFIVAGTTFAKIRHLRNEAGQEIEEAPPGTPVEILGWRELPAAGDQVIQGPDERRVRLAAEYRESIREREQDAAAHEKISEQRRLLSEQRRAEKAAEEGKHKRTDGSWGTQEQASDIENGNKMVNFVVKGDVHGSVEAVCAAIQEIGSQEIQPRVLLSSPGAITESDVEHAATSKSSIVNFNLPISGLIKRQAEKAGVKILDHSVIYHLTDEVKDHLSSFLGVDVSYKVLAEAEVLQIFPINIKRREYKNIAGCRIRNGTVERNHLLRVMRGGEKIFEGESLFKSPRTFWNNTNHAVK